MIARVWRGWTSSENADEYESLLRETILPGFKSIKGYRGGYIFREKEKEQEDEVGFMIVNFFSSLEAVIAFAGQEDYTVAVFEPEARALLARVEPVAMHYEVKDAFLFEAPNQSQEL